MKKVTTNYATFTRKIGRNRGKPRLWLEGAILQSSGFHHGTRFSVSFDAPQRTIMITRTDEGTRRVAGTSARPIIDINTARIDVTLGNATEVTLTIIEGGILVTPKSDEVAVQS